MDKTVKKYWALKKQLWKDYPRFELLGKMESGFTYLWKVYDGNSLNHVHSLRIHFNVRGFRGYDNAYIRTKLLSLETGEYEIVDFDTGIPSTGFKPRYRLQVIEENREWILKWYTSYLKRSNYVKLG